MKELGKVVIYFFLGFILFTSSFVFADSNGIWYDAKDVRGGVFGNDEQDVTFFYSFINFVNFQDNAYFLDWVGIMTQNPSVELEVNGTIKTNKLLADNLRNQRCGLHQAIVGFDANGDIICETIYEYLWKYSGWGTCQGACETTGNQFRTVWCEREDGITVDNEFCVNGANNAQPSPSQNCWTGTCSYNVCIYNQRYSPSSGWYQSGWQCSKNGAETTMLSLGDDTGWKNQGFKLVNYGPNNVCIYNRRYSPSSGWYQSGWQCSKNGAGTTMLSLGDDTGWKNQGFKLVNYG